MTTVKFLKCDRCGIASNSLDYNHQDFYSMNSEQVYVDGSQYHTVCGHIVYPGGKKSHQDLCHHCHEDYIQKFLNNKENNVIK